MPRSASRGSFTTNGLCLDEWPVQLRFETPFTNGRLRPGEAVWTAAQLSSLNSDPRWRANETWTIQLTVTSTCPHSQRFGFTFGTGSLVVTVPAKAKDLTLRIVGEIDVVHTPNDAHLDALDECPGDVLFHEVSLR